MITPAIASHKTKFNTSKSKLLNIILLTLLATGVVSCNTTKQISSQNTTPQLRDTLLVDRDGNKYAIKAFSGNNLWMTTNLKLNIPGSYCCDDTAANCERYGRLYTWEAAQEACGLLGVGWRLPAEEDWKQLAAPYAAIAKDSVEARKKAYQALLYTGDAQFNAVLGGGRAPDGECRRLEAHGFYWMATEHDSSMAWFANFAKGSQALYRQRDGEKDIAFSVRCIKPTTH